MIQVFFQRVSQKGMILLLFFASCAFLWGSYLRYEGLRNDLWLDEIWSLREVEKLRSVLGVYTDLHADGHSSLYSVFLYILHLLTNSRGALLYRLPSLLIWLGGLGIFIYLTKDRVRSLLFVSLSSLSFLFVLYTSEARGYGPMLGCALASYAFLSTFLKNGTKGGAIGFILCAAGAFLFHYTYLQFYFGLSVWGLTDFLKQRDRLYSLWKLGVLLSPCILFAFIGYFVIAQFDESQHPSTSILDLIVNTLSVSSGGPLIGLQSPVLILAMACLTFFLAVAAIRQLFDIKDSEWFLYVAGILVAPSLLLLVASGRYLETRYFLPAVLFLYLLFSRTGSFIFHQGKLQQLMVLCFLILFGIGNQFLNQRFLRYGRGEYQRAITFMAAHSAEKEIRISGDHPFRNKMVVDFYCEKLPPPYTCRYVADDNTLAQWYLVHSRKLDFQPQKTIEPYPGKKFLLQSSFPYSAQSGWGWFVYHHSFE